MPKGASEKGMRQGDGGRIRNGSRHGGTALRVMQGGFEVSRAVMEHMQQAQQLQLVEGIIPFFRDREASRQGCPRRVAAAAREHR